jgi:hypothetical protein
MWPLGTILSKPYVTMAILAKRTSARMLACILMATGCGNCALAEETDTHAIRSWQAQCSARYNQRIVPFARGRRPVRSLKPNRNQLAEIRPNGYWNGLVLFVAPRVSAQVRFYFAIRVEAGEASDAWQTVERSPVLTELTKNGTFAHAAVQIDRRYAERKRDRQREPRIVDALKLAASECIELAR